MKTLKTTLSRLRHVSRESRGDPTLLSPKGGHGSDEALLAQMARMLSEPFYGGRPLSTTRATSLEVERQEMPAWAEGIEFLAGSGVEVVSGRFESTNDRLVGLFDEQQGVRAPPRDLQPELVPGLRAEVGSMRLRSPPLSHVATISRYESRRHASIDSADEFVSLALRVRQEIERAARRFLNVQVGLSRRWNRILGDDSST